ncbi:MAG: PilZ domain-containing protein [Myxococcota bacterium]|nr:PilZ domain-containing protein [Myxococcota bacterium]
MSPERRKYSRIATDQVISFAQIDHEARPALGRNVSTGGIRFETIDCEINLGETLRVTFNIEDETVVAIGTVAWATDVGSMTVDIGIEFTEIDPRAVRLLAEAVAESDQVLGDNEN